MYSTLREMQRKTAGKRLERHVAAQGEWKRRLRVMDPGPNGPGTHWSVATNKRKPTAKATRITVLSIVLLARSIFGHRLGSNWGLTVI